MRTVALDATQIRANLLRGQDAENRWPLNAVDESPLARSLAEATDRVASIEPGVKE